VADPIDDLLDYARRSLGVIVEVDENGYRRIFTAEHQYITRYPATPGRKERRYQEVVLALKKHGLVWPPPSKKEQRSMRRKEGS
jgi:hypothetical protein